MTESKRVTAEDVVSAYKSTGAKPRQGVWCRKERLDGCGDVIACGLGVMYYNEKNFLPSRSSDVVAWANEKYGDIYTAYFINGFDDPYHKRSTTLHGDACRGYCDGRAAYFASTGEKDPLLPKEDADAPAQD
jgi:hypothetical protein